MTITDTCTGQTGIETQLRPAGVGLTVPDCHVLTDIQRSRAVGDPNPLNGHALVDAHIASAVEHLTPQPTSETANSSKSASAEVLALTPPGPVPRRSSPILGAPVLADPLLALAADVLDDLEAVRIANENRLRQLTRTEKDGGDFCLTLDHPDVARLAALVDGLANAEHAATLNLQRMQRRHPLGPWMKTARGIGEKQGARLLAAIGDPYTRPELSYPDGRIEPSRPRTVSELWAYCGYHVIRPPGAHHCVDAHRSHAAGDLTSAVHELLDAQITCGGGTQPLTGHGGCGPHRRSAGGDLTGGDPDQRAIEHHASHVGVAAARVRGQRANWSATAKSRLYLIAVSIVKAGGPYREVYDRGREKYTDAIHQVPCRRCGPAGKPAQPGSPLSAGHQHARALRLISKAVLKDLWREAKRLHEQADQ